MKTFVITGATSGIGKITAIEIAKNSLDNQIIFNTRNLEKGEQVKQEIISASGNKNIHCFQGDFASLESVSNFAKNVIHKFPIIDVLLNNAGTWEMEFKESNDGIEMNFAVNHLAPFLLTNLLLPNILKSESGRIINTSSNAHRRNILQFNDIEFRNPDYNGLYSYAQSKLCNLLFSLSLKQQFEEANISNITINSLHPGVVKTALFDNMNEQDKSFLGNYITPEEGAQTSIFLALSNQVEGISGKYWHGHQEAESSEMSKNKDLADKLWRVSLDYVEKLLK